MKFVAYTRVSTEEQAQDGFGLPAQVDIINRIIVLHTPVLPEPDETERATLCFEDDVSGSLPPEKRPGLLEALEALEEGDIFVVARRDRLARDFIHAAAIEGLIARKGARLISGDAPDDDSPEGWLIRSILDVFAHYERLVIAFRTRAALAVKQRNGERTGSVPYGKDLAEDGKTLIENPEEMKAIDRMLACIELRWSYREIAEHLTKLGIPTKTGKKVWTHTAIARILERHAAERHRTGSHAAQS